MPVNVRERKTANLINLNHADTAKVIEASDSEEVYEYENHM